MKIKPLCFYAVILTSFLTFCNNSHIDNTPAPPIGGYNVYMGHIHNHTAFSDGKGTPYEAFAYARDIAKMDFLGITDHAEKINNEKWAILASAADEYNQDNRFVTFRGFEWSSSSNYGHIAVIETADYCRSDDTATDSFEKLCSWIKSRNGIAFFNHPGREDYNNREFNHFTTTPVDNFAGMELWNKKKGFDEFYYNDGYTTGDGNMGYYDEALQRGWHIGASGSGDDHSATWGTKQPFRLAVLARSKTRKDIITAFRERRFYSTLDLNLSLSFKINKKEMGSRISPGAYMAEIRADDGSEDDTFISVVLIKNGIIINSWSPGQKNIDITQNITASTNEYYYIRVKQSDGDEAISSPIWIE